MGDEVADDLSQPAAFAYPAPGTLGNTPTGASKVRGSGRSTCPWRECCRWATSTTLEFRVEAFNLLNNFNWGDPATNLDAGTFGRITTQTGSSRIMQFAVKFGF